MLRQWSPSFWALQTGSDMCGGGDGFVSACATCANAASCVCLPLSWPDCQWATAQYRAVSQRLGTLVLRYDAKNKADNRVSISSDQLSIFLLSLCSVAFISYLFLIFNLTLLGKITKIFITHLHGDHFFGLPGLLCTISLQCSPDGNKLPVDIYGPLGLKDFLQRTMALSRSQLVFPYVVHELVPTPNQCPEEEWDDVFSGKRDEDSCPEPQGDIICLNPAEDSYFLVDGGPVVIKAFRLFHRIPSFGFLVEEKPRTGKLNAQKLKELGRRASSSAVY